MPGGGKPEGVEARSAGEGPASAIIRVASRRAASTYCVSFISTRACSGVLVRARRTVQVSREGASNASSDGGGLVRFQNVYKLRRQTASPWSCWYTPVLLPRKLMASHSPANW